MMSGIARFKSLSMNMEKMLTHFRFIKTKSNCETTTHVSLKCSPGILVQPFTWPSYFVILVLVLKEIFLDNSE